MSLGVLQGRGKSRHRSGGVQGLGATGSNCWDQLAPCNPSQATQLHGQILGLMGALADAQRAAAAGDPNAMGAAQNFQMQINMLQSECNRLGIGCQTTLKAIRDKLAAYGCDASKGPFAEGLQQMANEKLSAADQIPESGIFDKATCAGFWKAFNRAPTVADVQASLDPSIATMFATQRHCGAPDNFSVTIPSCPKPPSTDARATSANKPPTTGYKPPPLVTTAPPYTPPPPKQMSMAMKGGLIAAVLVVGYAVGKKKGWIH